MADISDTVEYQKSFAHYRNDLFHYRYRSFHSIFHTSKELMNHLEINQLIKPRDVNTTSSSFFSQ